MDQTKPLIKISNASLAHNLGEENEVWSLRDINVEIFPQEHVIFFGPSGCGKSSLLNIIAGLERPTEGSIEVAGTDLTKLSRKEIIQYHQTTVGIVFQAYFLIPHLTARDNITLPQLFAKKSRKVRTSKTDELMQRFGITDFQHRRPAMLSGGQQQRIAIARALANDPLILLADEPAGNLDSTNTNIVLNLLSDFRNTDKKTIIHVTHNPQQLHYADRVFYMRDGKIHKIVINPKRGTEQRREITEFELLEQSHPYLKESEVSAKILLNRITSSYNVSTQQKIEGAISQYLEKKITEEELLATLDREPISLYKQTAKNLVEQVVIFGRQMEYVQEKADASQERTLEEKAYAIREHLLKHYDGILGFEQVQRLEQGLIQRIGDKLSASGFEGFLDLPYKDGGVGINKRTAANFSRDVEVILMKRK